MRSVPENMAVSRQNALSELFTSNVERRNDGWREDSSIRAVSVMQVEFRIKN